MNSSFGNIPGFQNLNIYQGKQYQKSRTNISLLPLLLLLLPLLLSFCSSPLPCSSPSLLLILPFLAPPDFPGAAAHSLSLYSLLLFSPLLPSFVRSFYSLLFARSCSLLLPPAGSCWLLLAPAGSCWLLLAPAGSCWLPLLLARAAPAGSCCWLLLLVPAAGSCCWFLLLAPAAGSCC